MRVHITTCQTGSENWRTVERRLRELYELSDMRHALVDDPEAADIILIGHERTIHLSIDVIDHEVANDFPTKSVSIHDSDFAPLLHLVFIHPTDDQCLVMAELEQEPTLYAERTLNPFIQDHQISDADFRGRDLLFSFIGRNSDQVRERLFALKFDRKDILVQDSSEFDLWSSDVERNEKLERQRRYYSTLLRSKFCLCPRGSGMGSMRLFESMQLGVAPVVIADNWIPPRGPIWSESCLFVKEKDVADIDSVVASNEARYEQLGRAAREAYSTFFAREVYFNYIVENCLAMLEEQPIPEVFYWSLRRPLAFGLRLRNALKLKTRLSHLNQRLGNILRGQSQNFTGVFF